MLQCIHGGKRRTELSCDRTMNQNMIQLSHICDWGEQTACLLNQISCSSVIRSHLESLYWLSELLTPLRIHWTSTLSGWTSTLRCCRCGFKLDWPGTDRIHGSRNLYVFLLIFFLLIYIKLDIRAIKCVSALFQSRIWIRSFSNIVGNTSKPAGCTIYVLVLFPRERRDFTTERFSS